MEWKRTGAGKKHALLNFFSSMIYAFLRGAETHYFAKYFHIFEMKSKFLTKLKDWNENAQAQGKSMYYRIFFSSVIFMLFCAAQENMILLNKIIFMKWNQSF